ncbi:MAG TPA: MFS transporter [Alphaproteobacteria bacterium]|nr:MFS transporter [Alphaproteobacteria bacterium]
MDAATRRRTIIGIYGTAFFSLSIVPMISILVPLWAVQHLNATPLWVGVAVGARSFLPLLFSIHGGALMDRLGTRRVMAWCGIVTLILFPLYVIWDTMLGLIALQLVIGLSQGLSWVGAQALYGQMSRGSAAHAGRLTFFSNLGSFLGPLVAGFAADAAGVVGGFAAVSGWSIALCALTFLIPRSVDGASARAAVKVEALLPRVDDYRRAATLCLIPAVALVLAFTFVRIAISGMQSSFYVVYLASIDLTGTQIGLLVGCANFIASPAALLTGPAQRLMPGSWVMVWMTVVCVTFMTITPALSNFWLLLAASAMYGLGVGVGFPTLLSLLTLAVPVELQGMAAGLRTTANRAATLVIPVGMGALAEFWGIEASFYVLGAVLMGATLILGVLIRRGFGRVD